MDSSDIGFKSNFATMEGDVVVKRRADRAFHKWGCELCDVVDGLNIPIDTDG